MSISSIEDLLIKYLLADASVAALVGTRIYPLRLPQKVTLPAIVTTRISGVRIGNLHGIASAAEPRYQVDAWAVNQAGAHALGAAIRQALEAYVGTWTDGNSPPVVSARVSVRFETERDLFEEEINGGLCRHSADYFIFHGTNSGAL
jgi:hypothetical protein